MRFLVTGANGLIGSRLCTQLAAKGHAVWGVSRGPRRAQGPFEYLSCELTDAAQVRAAFESARPEVVLHPASMTEVDRCEKEPVAAWANNASATALVAEQCRGTGAHLVHVSTDYVFDGEAGPYSEEDLPNPRGAYALSKHAAEEAVRVLAPSWAIARTAVVYGWPAAGRPNFGAWLVGALERKEKVRLFEDQFVSPSFADSVAAMLAELGERRLSGTWNICGGAVVNRVQFGAALCEVFGFDAGLLVATRLKDANLASPRPLHAGLKADKARAHLAEKPLDLAESLRRFHAAYLSPRGGGPS
jgi:dTDP-4-dehydrorhamnose reductase